MATRRAFDANAPDVDPHAPAEQQRATFACKAYGCRLPGTLSGVCSHHWEAHTHDWQNVTSILLTMAPLITEINRARTVLCNPGSDPKVQVYGHEEAHARLAPSLDADQTEFMAKNTFTDYHSWMYRIEQLVDNGVRKVMKRRRNEADTNHPAYAARHRARVQAAQIPGQAADFIAQEFES